MSARTLRAPLGAVLAAAPLLVLVLAGPAPAQVDAESFARLGFNFSPPGAQSAALGGAYIPLAKDATAAETNPAGLTVLLEPEVTLEFKAVEYTRTLPREAGGGAGGRDFSDEVAMPSFASVVYPVREGITLAAFRHELVNFRSTVWSSGFDRGDNTFLNPFTSVLELQVVNYGAAGAYQLSPRVSVGVSAGVSLLGMDVDFPRYRIADFSDQFLRNRLVVDESGSSIFLNVGVLAQLHEQVTVGAVYKRRSAFDDLEFELRQAEGPTTTETGSLDIPDALGAGVAIRTSDRLTVTADAVLQQYSQVAEEVAVLFSGASPDDYVADDGVDLHAGAEYVLFVGRTPVALRAGVARIAPSNTYYQGSSSTERALWGTEPADADVQLTGGVGFVLGRRISVDAAGVLGDQRQELVLSTGVFLGG